MTIVETHDRALAAWRAAGGDAVLVHVDAHHDLWFVPRSGLVTPANVVRAALRERVVREVFWIVPDPAWTSAASRRALMKHLRRIADPRAALVDRESAIETLVEQRPLHVLPMASDAAPCRDRLPDRAILDIDADFLTIGSIDYKTRGLATRPWTGPGDVAARLQPLAGRAAAITVTRSCDGGFTPLAYRGLADALAARFEGDERRARAFETVVDALDLAGDAAVRAVGHELEGPAHASACYALAQIEGAAGRFAVAHDWMRRAVDADRAYRSAWRTRGFVEFFANRFDTAAREFGRGLRIDPDDALARLGAGMTARATRRIRDALSALSRVRDLDPSLVDAHVELADVFVTLARWHDARDRLEDAVRLACDGGRTIGPDGWEPAAADIGWMHARLAAIASRTGDRAKVAAHADAALAHGFDAAPLRRRMATLALRNRAWRSLQAHAAAAVRLAARARWHQWRVATQDLPLPVWR